MSSGGKIGIIGGSGIYDMEGFEAGEEVSVDTPWGLPSDLFIIGKLDGKDLVFLPRHGRGHRINPSNINYRANIYGMKALGVEWIISASAVGSYKEEMKPQDIVVIDQFFDRTNGNRKMTFFDEELVVHVAFSEPICPALADLVYGAAEEVGASVHKGGTYVNMEGPAFSTKAESLFFKGSGMDVIGMTNLAEAKLAREAEICYSTMALVTDYDAWHEEVEAVSVAQVIENLQANAETARRVIRSAVAGLPENKAECGCAKTLEISIITQSDSVPAELKERLSLLTGKYIK